MPRGANEGPVGDISSMDAEISHVAARQHGNITRAQLIALGLADGGIGHRVSCGRLYRVHTSVYAVGRPPVTPLERAAAAVLACGPGAALSHGSAMTLWGFFKRWQRQLEVTVPGDRRPDGLKVHRSSTLDRNDMTTQLGIRVTSPARTLLDYAPRMSERSLRRAVNDALLSTHLNRHALAELLARLPRHPGAAALAPFATERGGPTRSEFEDAFIAFCERFGLPRPVINTKVAGYEVDALFERECLIVELDGYAFHSGRTAFERDRNRDADTLAAGYPTVRLTWERMIGGPQREAARLLGILTATRQRPPPGS